MGGEIMPQMFTFNRGKCTAYIWASSEELARIKAEEEFKKHEDPDGLIPEGWVSEKSSFLATALENEEEKMLPKIKWIRSGGFLDSLSEKQLEDIALWLEIEFGEERIPIAELLKCGGEIFHEGIRGFLHGEEIQLNIIKRLAGEGGLTFKSDDEDTVQFTCNDTNIPAIECSANGMGNALMDCVVRYLKMKDER
jgi:hypothetical protein